MKAKRFIKQLVFISFCLIIFTPIALTLAFAAVVELDRYKFHSSFEKTPEKYTRLVPLYLEASKPKLLVDTTDFLGGGYWAMEMQLSDNAADSIIKDSKYLKKDKWEKTPILENMIQSGTNTRPKAEFFNYISYDKCEGCLQLYKDAQSEGGYYLTPEAPRTTRVGIVLVPFAKRVYYIVSGN